MQGNRLSMKLLTLSQCPAHYLSCMLMDHTIFLVTKSRVRGGGGGFLPFYIESLSLAAIPASLSTLSTYCVMVSSRAPFSKL